MKIRIYEVQDIPQLVKIQNYVVTSIIYSLKMTVQNHKHMVVRIGNHSIFESMYDIDDDYAIAIYKGEEVENIKAFYKRCIKIKNHWLS